MIYAIGDIHGELEKLDELLELLPLESDDTLVFVGDYIDRGPDARGVVERMIRLRDQRHCVFLLGNHESMLLDFLGWTDEAYFGGDAFLMNGGDRTLASYGYFDRENPDRETFQLPKDHEDFLLSLQLYHREGDYLFVHAGLGAPQLKYEDPAYAVKKTRAEDLHSRLTVRIIGDLSVGDPVVAKHVLATRVAAPRINDGLALVVVRENASSGRHDL